MRPALGAAIAALVCLTACSNGGVRIALEEVVPRTTNGSTTTCTIPSPTTSSPGTTSPSTSLPSTSTPGTSAASTVTTGVTPTSPPSTSPPPTSAPVTNTSTATTVVVRDLGLGDQGADVAEVQHRLIELGYWLPAVSGEFDSGTAHAVTAFEKTHLLEPDGTLTLDDRALLDVAERQVGRSSEGHVVEVDIARQVVMVVDDGVATWVLDTSTGSRPGLTPVGSYRIGREIDGLRVSPLGELYRPKYVVDGVAIHGYPEVPPQPASHGCIRLTNDAMDAVWEMELAPIGTRVLIYDD